MNPAIKRSRARSPELCELRIANLTSVSIPTEEQVRNDKEACVRQYCKGAGKGIGNSLYDP
jgi:hypothetical protein